MKKYLINVMDIETFTEDRKLFPYCICLRFNNKFVSFWYSTNIVLDFLEYMSENSKEEEVTIYTHNINFDGLIILDAIKEKDIFFDFFIREHNLYWIRISYLKVTILIRCSYKLIPLSVNNLGQLIGSKKKTFPYKFVTRNNLDYNGKIPSLCYFDDKNDYLIFKSENHWFNLKKVSIAYCFQDIRIVFEVLSNIIPILESFYGSISIIKRSFSFSSVSYKLYSKKFDFKNITSSKVLLSHSQYIRNAYYGGRCEVFGNPRSEEIIHYFDYKGMYAQCMMEKFPYGEPIVKKEKLNLENIGFHTIRFKVDTYLPFLPTKHHKLLFPNGELIGTYWYEEILNAIKHSRCQILEHYSSIEYPSEDHIFRDFVDKFMKVRELGIYYNILGKNIINGLYGSFALNDEDEIYIVTLSEAEFNSYKSRVDVISYKKIGNAYLIKVAKNPKSAKLLDKKSVWDLGYKKRNVAYAAIIASKARIKLNNSLNLVIKDGGRLYYTDTDSIFAGYKDDRLDKILGDIKWTKTYTDGVFISSKFYFLKEEVIRLKGINKNSYDFEEVKAGFYEGRKDFYFKEQLSFTKTNLELYELINDKYIKMQAYDKRIFTSDMKDTSPIAFQTNNVYQ